MFNSYQISTLANGLRVITIPMTAVPSVTVLVIVAAGSRYESKDVNGIFHFLEHMAFKGTQTRPSSLAISEIIDGIGGEFNAFTSKDHTGYYIKAHNKHLELVFDVLSDMLLNSLLAEEEIAKERGVIIEEINMYQDTPMRKVSDLYEELLYGDHPLGWEISGSVVNIKKITRADFLAYMERFYTPQNVAVTVAGSIPAGLTGSGKNPSIELSEKWLGSWQRRQSSQFIKANDNQTKPGLLVRYKKTEQAHLCIGVRAYALASPKRYALAVLSAILGGGMSSRLFIEVREKRGLAYYVRSSGEQYHDVGHFVTQAGVDVKRITDAIAVIIGQYQGIANNQLPVTPQELRRAKEYLKGRLILELEDSRSVAGLYATQEILEGKIRTPKTILEQLEAVTQEEVAAVAKDIFVSKKLNLAVIGPFKDQHRFEKLLT